MGIMGQKNLSNQNGQGLVEYLIIVALIAVGSIAVMSAVGASVQSKFAQVAESLGAQVRGKVQAPVVSEKSYRKKDLKDFMEGSLRSNEENRD
jgi:pilus assembly protein Flp/PilA